MQKPRQLRLFGDKRTRTGAYLGDAKNIRIFVKVCAENVRTAREQGFPPHEIEKRWQLLLRVWRALDDARVRVAALRRAGDA